MECCCSAAIFRPSRWLSSSINFLLPRYRRATRENAFAYDKCDLDSCVFYLIYKPTSNASVPWRLTRSSPATTWNRCDDYPTPFLPLSSAGHPSSCFAAARSRSSSRWLRRDTVRRACNWRPGRSSGPCWRFYWRDPRRSGYSCFRPAARSPATHGQSWPFGSSR